MIAVNTTWCLAAETERRIHRCTGFTGCTTLGERDEAAPSGPQLCGTGSGLVRNPVNLWIVFRLYL